MQSGLCRAGTHRGRCDANLWASEAVEVGYLYGGTAALVMGVNAFIRRESHR